AREPGRYSNPIGAVSIQEQRSASLVYALPVNNGHRNLRAIARRCPEAFGRVLARIVTARHLLPPQQRCGSAPHVVVIYAGRRGQALIVVTISRRLEVRRGGRRRGIDGFGEWNCLPESTTKIVNAQAVQSVRFLHYHCKIPKQIY